MADKNDAPRRASPEAARSTGDGSPFSMPLEKGMDILAEPSLINAPGEKTSAGIPEEAEREKVSREPSPSAKANPSVVAHYHGPRFLTFLLLMFLFPFLFNLGSELYLLARTAVMAQMAGLQPSAAPPPHPSSGKSDADKMIDSLAMVIANQEKLLRDAGQRIVIIHPGYTGLSSYDEEKNKVKELVGIDLDDPVTGSEKFGKIKSAEILSAVISSFDHILLNAAQNNTSEFRVKNALEAKKQALKRLQEIR